MRAHREPCIPPPIPKNDEPIIALTDYCLYGPGQLGQQGKKSSSSPHPPSPFVNKSVNYTHSGAPLVRLPACLPAAGYGGPPACAACIQSILAVRAVSGNWLARPASLLVVKMQKS